MEETFIHVGEHESSSVLLIAEQRLPQHQPPASCLIHTAPCSQPTAFPVKEAQQTGPGSVEPGYVRLACEQHDIGNNDEIGNSL